MDRFVRPILNTDLDIICREAQPEDVQAIQGLFALVYHGLGYYSSEFVNNAEVLKAETIDRDHHLWLVAEDLTQSKIVGATSFYIDRDNRLAKGTADVVSPGARHGGIGGGLIKIAVEYLTKEHDLVDVIYGTTRTVSEGPSKMVSGLGFHRMGLFPNALQVDTLEHLNLDLHLTADALKRRRKRPYVFKPFVEIYNIARRQLGLEPAVTVQEREPLHLSRSRIPLKLVSENSVVILRFRQYLEQQRLSNSFFPFHVPNWLLSSEDGGTEVFVWYSDRGRQASILGYRTDRVDVHDLLNSVAYALQKLGASYVELLVDAYDYMLQQEAYTARYIPSAYFPAMRLAADGLRDDYFVLSRTFQLLDFTEAWVLPENYPYFQAYLRCYQDLYIKPHLAR